MSTVRWSGRNKATASGSSGGVFEAFAERLPLGTNLLSSLVRDESATTGGHPTAGTATLPDTPPDVMPDRLVRAVEDGL